MSDESVTEFSLRVTHRQLTEAQRTLPPPATYDEAVAVTALAAVLALVDGAVVEWEGKKFGRLEVTE